MIEHEIIAWCNSEKAGVCLCFGSTVDFDTDHFICPSAEWVIEGIGDSFWENCDEFKAGVEHAKHLEQQDSALSKREALFEVFGCFSIHYEVDGEKVDLNYDIDIDEMIYSMLELL